MLDESKTDRPGVFTRLPLCLVLAVVCTAMCLIPGDAVAHRFQMRAAAPKRGAARISTAAQTQLLLSDMSEPSQELPQGVPVWYDWAERPRTHQVVPLGSFRAFTAWGQLYRCAGTSASAGATVDLRDLQTWVLLRGSSQWRRIQFSSYLGGAAFAEDYAGPTVAGRYSASSSGTSAQLVSGHNFHFWPDAGRVNLNAEDVAALTVAVEARLKPTREPGTPCFVLSVGGDVWKSLTAPAGGSNSEDVGIGRFKQVERHWRLFTMTTATAERLRKHPLPPISSVADDF